MDTADMIWAWLPWPMNPAGMMSALLVYGLAMATGWVGACIMIRAVLANDDADLAEMRAELDDAWALIDTLEAVVIDDRAA